MQYAEYVEYKFYMCILLVGREKLHVGEAGRQGFEVAFALYIGEESGEERLAVWRGKTALPSARFGERQ